MRDFSLSERHNTDAAYGYARRFTPGAARLARAVETVTRRPLPALRPTACGTPSPSAFAIGEPLYNATPDEGEKAITALAVMCDFSARDVQIQEMRSGMGPQKAKHFLSSMATVAVSADTVLPHWRDVRGTVTINGETVARPYTVGSRLGLGDILAHASDSEQLVPGELFGIGALSAGSGMEINRWLDHGDILELDIPRRRPLRPGGYRSGRKNSVRSAASRAGSSWAAK